MQHKFRLKKPYKLFSKVLPKGRIIKLAKSKGQELVEKGIAEAVIEETASFEDLTGNTKAKNSPKEN